MTDNILKPWFDPKKLHILSLATSDRIERDNIGTYVRVKGYQVRFIKEYEPNKDARTAMGLEGHIKAEGINSVEVE